MTDELSGTCGQCGASVYKAHVDTGIARYEGGKLMCVHCTVEYEKAHDGDVSDDSLAPIAFDDEDNDRPRGRSAMSESRIHGASVATLGQSGAWTENRYTRTLRKDTDGATRCRTFHAKLSGPAIEFMNQQINQWLDENPEIVIKFAATNIGPFEGKHTEQNLIITVFY